MAFAVERLANVEHASPSLIELAGLELGRDPRPQVEELARNGQAESSEETKAKWLFIVLAWILAHRDEYADPLDAVEEVYTDFDFPERIAGFVRYMPSHEPDLGSRQLHEARLYSKWTDFLEECTKQYSPFREGA